VEWTFKMAHKQVRVSFRYPRPRVTSGLEEVSTVKCNLIIIRSGIS
jgi:hypothetical protein